MATQLRFRGAYAPGQPVALRFGSTDVGPPPPPVEVVAAGLLPTQLSGYVVASQPTTVFISGVVGAAQLQGHVSAEYQSRRDMSVTASVASKVGQAVPLVPVFVSSFQQNRTPPASSKVSWQEATPNLSARVSRFQDYRATPTPIRPRFQDATPLVPRPALSRFQDYKALPAFRRGRFQDATPIVPSPTMIRFQEAIRTYNASRQRYQDATPHSRGYFEREGQALVLIAGAPRGRFQDAIYPPPGRSPKPPIPGPDPCYVPPPGSNVQLVFAMPWKDSTRLRFYCELHGGLPNPSHETIVIPVRRVYIVENNVSLVKLSNGEVIPAESASLQLDYKSWTWNFSARVPAAYLPEFLRAPGDPRVVLELFINGTRIRVAVDDWRRDRTFDQSSLTLSGRGINSELASPDAPSMIFGNDSDLTSQQWAYNALTVNGVALDWSLDWQIPDWLIPGGAVTVTGSYMDALTALATGGGGYIQPHLNLRRLRFLPKYPTRPWNWADVDPDFELPSDIVTVEGMSIEERPDYNRVFVQGMKSGVRVVGTRLGTAGDLVAPDVTDQFITDLLAGQGRAESVLGEAGHVINYSLRLPVLPAVGLLTPGVFVEYVDGSVRRKGLARSISVEASREETWQTIGVETHV